MTDHNDLPTTLDQKFEAIERAIATIRPDEGRSEYVTILVRQTDLGEWRLSFVNKLGITSGNFGPDIENMLTRLFDYLYEIGAGNWAAHRNEEPRG